MELLEGRRVMAADTQLPLHNALMAPDVNRDFSVSPVDALLVINALHARSRGGVGEGESPYSYTPNKDSFLDVSNDGKVSPLDALLVINQLRGEGETLKLVSFRIEFLNAAGNVITQASVGETVTARVYVKDLRTLANPVDLPDIDNPPDVEGAPNTFPNPADGDLDRNGNGIFDIGPDDSFATGVFSAGIDLDLTGSEPVGNLVTHVRPGTFISSLTFGPRINSFPEGRPGAVGSDEEFNEVSAFDLSLNTRPLQDQNIDPTRNELFFSTRFTLLSPGSFAITPNFAETAFDASGAPSISPTFIRTYRGSSGIAVPEAQQEYITGTLAILSDPTSPVAVDDTVSSPEDQPLILAGVGSTVTPPLIQNDTVTSGRTLTVTAVSAISGITQGTVSGLTYTPPVDFSGQDRVTYTIRDSNGLTSSATVTINVSPVNDAPVAGDDVASGFLNEPVTIAISSLLLNDSPGPGEGPSPGVPGQSLSISSVATTSGSVQIVGTDVVYTPPADFIGDRTFTYTLVDSGTPPRTAVGTVTVTIDPREVPFARRDTASTTEISAGQPQTGVSIPVLANDLVNVGATPVLVRFDATSARGGTITANVDGTLQYVPAFEFNGPDTFKYTLSDTLEPGTESVATVTVNVADVNDAPTASNDNANGTEDTPVTIAIGTLLLNDSPGLGETAADTSTPQTLTLSIPSGSSTNGSAVVSGSNVIFTPNLNVNGNVTFTYVVTDSGTPALTATATVVVNLAAVNDAPVTAPDRVSTNEDTPLVITDLQSLLLNDSAGPADEPQGLTLVSVSKPAATLGTVAFNAVAGTITYTPALNFNGDETFTYVVRDSEGAEGTGTVTVTVNPINDAPIAGVDSVTAFKGVALQIPVADLVANDSPGPANESGQTPLRITSVFSAVNGTVSLNAATGVITFTPAADFSGAASFQYTVQDNGPSGGTNVNSSTGTVNVTVRDFVPTDITGTVWVDETNDGVIDSAERKLGGVEVTLTGNALGIPIAARTYITLADGSYHFSNLAPGQYVVTYNRPLYMIDGRDVAGDLGDADSVSNQFTVNVAQPGGAEADGYNFAVTGIEAGYGRSLDQLASRYYMNDPNLAYRGLYAAIGADNSALWMAKLDGFEAMVTGEVVLNAAGNRLQLTMVDANQNVYTASLTSSQFVVTTDRISGNKLIRVLGSAASINFQQISLAAPPPVAINRYLEAIDEIFSQEGW